MSVLCTDRQKLLDSVFGGVILMDRTYHMNKYCMPLYGLAVENSQSHALAVVYLRLCTIRGRHRAWEVSIQTMANFTISTA